MSKKQVTDTFRIAENAFQMYEFLLQRGVSPQEAKRATIEYFSSPEPPYALPWPGPVTGVDNAGAINNVIVPDTGMPTIYLEGLPQSREPYPTPNQSPYGIGSSSEPYQSFLTPDPNSVGSQSNVYDVNNPPTPSTPNWIGTASKVNSEPSMEGEHGFNVTKAIPEWRYNIEDSQVHPLKIPDIILPPSGAVMEIRMDEIKFPVKSIQEAVQDLKRQFGWITTDYLSRAQELLDDNSELYLVRAAGETITDHRGEGEEYRRKLSAQELDSMTRTAIGKSIDINHQPEFDTDSVILDAEFDKNRKEIQMLIMVNDNTINDAINDGSIDAVSINGGMPRTESIEPCDHDCSTGNCELCLVPKGVVLGELDGIGMTFVVTNPKGIYWKNHYIPSAEPGIKFTKLQRV